MDKYGGSLLNRSRNCDFEQVGDILIVNPLTHSALVETDEYFMDDQSGYKAVKSDGVIYFHPDMDEFADYDSDDLHLLYKAEQSHFWFVNRREVIRRVFQKYVGLQMQLIEIGAGTGNIAQMLSQMGYPISVGEIHAVGLHYAKSYGIQNLYQFNLLEAPFVEHFDGVAMFDVLEHIEHDHDAIRNVALMLRPNGLVILTVPAHSWLWSQDDIIGHHKRRYTRSSLSQVLTDNGFEVLHISYFFIAILPLLLLRTLIRNANKPIPKQLNKEIKMNKLLNFILHQVTQFENRWLPDVKFPFGGSLIAVARKMGG